MKQGRVADIERGGEPRAILDVLAEMFRERAEGDGPSPTGPAYDSSQGHGGRDLEDGGATGRFDFDLAEFPLFRFYKNSPGKHDREPLEYRDEIEGREGERVAREWKAYPGPFGFGGPSTQVLLYDLLQLYAEQGCRGSQLQFGTIRSLLLRRGERNPSGKDYDRVRRDMDVLRGYDFHCRNAFWDRSRRAYVDMNWRLFGSVFYFKSRPSSVADDLPFGFIEVSPVLQQIARTRGFFPLGFPSALFYELRPLEQRLAVYLAKKFASQQVHRRFVEDLAKALPIEAARPRDVRAILKDTAEGLLERKLPILASYRIAGPRDGRYLAEFVRQSVPKGKVVRDVAAASKLSAAETLLVERVVAETVSPGDRPWWTQCVLRLGRDPMERALGMLGEAGRTGQVRNRAALLTKILKDIAGESGIALRDG